jgi:hypothetical protein
MASLRTRLDRVASEATTQQTADRDKGNSKAEKDQDSDVQKDIWVYMVDETYTVMKAAQTETKLAHILVRTL